MLRDERQLRPLVARFRDGGPDRNRGWYPECGRETRYLAATHEPAATVSRPVLQAGYPARFRAAAQPEERLSRHRNPADSFATCAAAPENPAIRTQQLTPRRLAPPSEGSQAGR